MRLHFSKWQGTGNDFILVDDRKSVFPVADLSLVRELCDRHFGIGSDGLILIQPPRDTGTTFHMEFFNPDGSRSFCGNGSRCAFAFHSQLVADRGPVAFTAIDGEHVGEWQGDRVVVTLLPVKHVSRDSEELDFMDTGSPHELVWVKDPQEVDLVTEGRRRRYSGARGPGGTNVNFVALSGNGISMRTYERGVEGETLSCGTGVVAAALSTLGRHAVQTPLHVTTKGGELWVEAEPAPEGGWRKIRLIGAAQEVFVGNIEI